MRFLSETLHGKLPSEFEDIHPNILQWYYFTHGEPACHPSYQTGAGHPADEDSDPSSSDLNSMDRSVLDDEEESDLQTQIVVDLQANVNHKPVTVPWVQIPLSNPAHAALFNNTFTQVCLAGAVPDGSSVKPVEWGTGRYPDHKCISVGRRSWQLVIQLTLHIWLPRAITWTQGLHVMQTLLHHHR
jgi:hypothetical protein